MPLLRNDPFGACPGMKKAPHRGAFEASRARQGSTTFFDDFHQMRDLVDHAAHGGGILQLAGLVHLVQAQTDERRALVGGAADRGADLLDDDGFCHGSQASSATMLDSAGASSRLGRISATFLPRRDATWRGLCSLPRPSIVARIML